MPRNPTISNRSNPSPNLTISPPPMKFGKTLARFSKTLIPLPKPLLRPFSSPADRRRPTNDAADSPAYLRSMLRRPPTVNPWRVRPNSCSFIGTVIRPVKRCGGRNPSSGSYTVLEVAPQPPRRGSGPASGSSTFRILLAMKDKLSEISLRHLKPNDYIYVSGCLSSNEKVDASGKHQIFYKVTVSELNFVKRPGQNSASKQPENAAAELPATAHSAGEFDHGNTSLDSETRHKDRLRLWQVFFASPHEWWDNRKGKRYPGKPDFKHKDTKECLWLSPDDPPWVRKQLQLYDSNMAISHHRSSGWKPEDFD